MFDFIKNLIKKYKCSCEEKRVDKVYLKVRKKLCMQEFEIAKLDDGNYAVLRFLKNGRHAIIGKYPSLLDAKKAFIAVYNSLNKEV